jgi:hypothetical protein
MNLMMTTRLAMFLGLLCCVARGAEHSGERTEAAPVSVFVFESSMNPKKWPDAMTSWRSRCKVALRNEKPGGGGNATALAQSFIPRCKTIAAIELSAYPVSGSGWIRLDIHADDNNRPAHEVLARTWLRVDATCPVPHYGFMPFDVPDTPVVSDRRYWFTYVEFVARDSPIQSIMNLGYSPDNNYGDGQLLRRNYFTPSQESDIRFKIIEECPTVPGLREPTEEERGAVPQSNGHWREVPPRAAQERANSLWSSKVLGLTGRLIIRQEPYEDGYGLNVDLYNDSGSSVLIPLWSPKSVRISVCSQEGTLVSPEEESLRALYGSERHVSFPSHGYAAFSVPGSGKLQQSNGQAILRWNDHHWSLSPGIYELRGEYQSISGAPSPPEGTHLWDGYLTFSPVLIVVKKDGTAEPCAAPLPSEGAPSEGR